MSTQEVLEVADVDILTEEPPSREEESQTAEEALEDLRPSAPDPRELIEKIAQEFDQEFTLDRDESSAPLEESAAVEEALRIVGSQDSGHEICREPAPAKSGTFTSSGLFTIVLALSLLATVLSGTLGLGEGVLPLPPLVGALLAVLLVCATYFFLCRGWSRRTSDQEAGERSDESPCETQSRSENLQDFVRGAIQEVDARLRDHDDTPSEKSSDATQVVDSPPREHETPREQSSSEDPQDAVRATTQKVDSRPVGEIDEQVQSLRQDMLKEIEKIRVYFESLLEKHVFRIHRDLKENEETIERLQEEAAELRKRSEELDAERAQLQRDCAEKERELADLRFDREKERRRQNKISRKRSRKKVRPGDGGS